MVRIPYSVFSNRKETKMNALNTTKLFEATLAAAAIIGAAAVIIPAVGILTAVGVVGAGLAAMAVLETKKRAY